MYWWFLTLIGPSFHGGSPADWLESEHRRKITYFVCQIAARSKIYMYMNGGTPCDINVIEKPLKGTFNRVLFRRRWQYGSIFIRLAPVRAEICEMPRNSKRIRSYSRSRSSKVYRTIDLDVNRKRICDFLLVINSNFGRISYRFRDIEVKARKWLDFPLPLGGNPLEFLVKTSCRD